MPDLPRLTVVMFTYSPALDHPRTVYACETIEALARNIRYAGDLRWHIADDGSGPGHVIRVRDFLRRYRSDVTPERDATISDAQRTGYGGSFNAMTSIVHGLDSDLVLCVEDDWELARALDLTPLAEALAASAGVMRSIRLGYLGWTEEMRGRLYRPLDGQTFLLLDPGSSEPHVFSGHPRLETVAYQRAVGLWPEGLPAGETELAITRRAEARVGVAWPLDIGINADASKANYFAHIGTVSIKEAEVHA